MGDLSNTQVGFIVPIPYVCAAAFVWFWSRHSDRTNERVGHTSGAMLLGAIGTGRRRVPDPDPARSWRWPRSASPRWVSSRRSHRSGSFRPPRWPGRQRRSGIALINSLGNLGGFASPYAVGVLVDKTGDSKYWVADVGRGVVHHRHRHLPVRPEDPRREGASRSHEDLLAKEVAAFDLPAEELHHRGDRTSHPLLHGKRRRNAGAPIATVVRRAGPAEQLPAPGVDAPRAYRTTPSTAARRSPSPTPPRT